MSTFSKKISRLSLLSLLSLMSLLSLLSLITHGCSGSYPIDEDGLLVTDRAECYVSNFELLGTDHLTVRVEGELPAIDTAAGTISIKAKFGTDLKHLYPQFSLVTDAKLEPKITGLTDFSDLERPRQYTVISGNRKVRKTYTIYVEVEHL
ncbi:MAG: hypothetical protein LBL94_11945 [Prevotellaceae bacterium]|nr:hypothetical protein [Prevotellaceae bacterium]